MIYWQDVPFIAVTLAIPVIAFIVPKRRRLFVFLLAIPCGLVIGFVVDLDASDYGPSCAWLGGSVIFLAIAGLAMVARDFNDWIRGRARPAKNKGVISCVSCGYNLESDKDRCPKCGVGNPTQDPGALLDPSSHLRRGPD